MLELLAHVLPRRNREISKFAYFRWPAHCPTAQFALTLVTWFIESCRRRKTLLKRANRVSTFVAKAAPSLSSPVPALFYGLIRP